MTIVGDLVKVMHRIIPNISNNIGCKGVCKWVDKGAWFLCSSPFENAIEGSQSEKQDTKVSGNKQSSENHKCSLPLAIASTVK